MRALRLVALLAASSVGLGGCAYGGHAARFDVSGAAATGDACTEVRQGIDAFNQGDFAATVDHFVRAVPLARAQAAAHDTRAAEQLLAAVTYYAHLAPQDYPSASLSSPEFARYKQITLGQCVADQPGSPPGSSASPSGPGVQA